MSIDQQNNLYGLVLIGGESRRMKQDKALLLYHGKEQYRYCYELLDKFCDQVYLSVREDQKEKYDRSAYSFIFDKEEYYGKGPLAGIITALETHSDKAFLVLACDLPNVNESTIEELTAKRKGEVATAFKSSHGGLPEPLCAIYEKGILPILKKSFVQDLLCPRKILINAGVSLIDLDNSEALSNINRLDELKEYQNL